MEKIKEAGNEDLRKGSTYEALWKYNHAVEVCKDCGLVSEMATIKGNCAQACLNMDLYVQAYEHAQRHVELNPDSPKVHWVIPMQGPSQGICTHLLRIQNNIPRSANTKRSRMVKCPNRISGKLPASLLMTLYSMNTYYQQVNEFPYPVPVHITFSIGIL